MAHICIQTPLRYLWPREPSSPICTVTILPRKMVLTVYSLPRCKGWGVQKPLDSCNWQTATASSPDNLSPCPRATRRWLCNALLYLHWGERGSARKREKRSDSASGSRCRSTHAQTAHYLFILFAALGISCSIRDLDPQLGVKTPGSTETQTLGHQGSPTSISWAIP